MLSGRYNVALPLDRQSNGFIEIPWDYFFSAFLSRSKLFFFPAIASATEKNLIAHPLFLRGWVFALFRSTGTEQRGKILTHSEIQLFFNGGLPNTFYR
jgi:hypothetical protein